MAEESVEPMEYDPTEIKIWDVNKNYPRLKKSGRIAAIVYTTEENTSYGSADKEQLCELWKTLGFDDIRVLANPTRGGLINFVSRLVADINATEMGQDAFSFAYIGHGNCRKVLNDGLTLKCEYMVLNEENNKPTVFSVEELLYMFTAFNCKGLAGCPKFFIYQCCRGEKTEFPVYVTASTCETTISPYSDMYCYHGSAPGHVSYYDPHNGKSLLISTICEVFLNDYQNHDFEQMITTVNERISRKKLGNGKCQTPVTSLGSLTKRLFFHGVGGTLPTMPGFGWVPHSAGDSNYEAVSSSAHSSSDPASLDEAVAKVVPREGLSDADYDYLKVMKIINAEMQGAFLFLLSVGCSKPSEQTFYDYLRGPPLSMSDRVFRQKFTANDRTAFLDNDPTGKSFDIYLLFKLVLVSCVGLTTDIQDRVKELKNISNKYTHRHVDDDLATAAKQLQDLLEKLYDAVAVAYGVNVTEEIWQMKRFITQILHS